MAYPKLTPIVTTGATEPRYIGDRFSDIVSVMDFGAVGDGVTDDTAAINDALAAGENKTVLFPGGTYKCSYALNVPSGCTIYGYGATLDWSAAPSGASRIRIEGAIGSSVSIDSNATSGNNSIAVQETGFAQNDLILISSNATYEASNQKRGELAVVRSVSNGSLTLVSPLNDSYAVSDDATVHKITPRNNVCIFGIKIIGCGSKAEQGSPVTTNEVGIRATLCRGLRIENCVFYHTDMMAIRIENSFGSVVKNNSISQDEVNGVPYVNDNGTLLPIQYGIALVNASCHSIIEGNIVANCRTGIDWTESGLGGSYHDIICNNQIQGAWSRGIGTHFSTFSFIISGNLLKGCRTGITMKTQNGNICDNHIFGTYNYYGQGGQTAGISLSFRAKNITVANNRIDNYVYGIECDDYVQDFVPSDLIICNNVIRNITQRGIVINSTGNTSDVYGLLIQGNMLKHVAGNYIDIDGEFVGAKISNNYFEDYNTATVGVGIQLHGTNKTQITENSFGSLLPVKVGNSSHSTPLATRFLIATNNIFDHTTGFLSGSPSNFIFKNNIKITSSPEVTISSGVITIPAGVAFISIHTENNESSDNLDTINGGNTGDVVVFRAASNSNDVVFKDNTGNLHLNGDFTLNHSGDAITLLFTGSYWAEVSRSDNDS